MILIYINIIDLKCRKCKGYHEITEDQNKKLHDNEETVTDSSYLGDRINSEGGGEAVVTSRTRLGWATCRDLISVKKIPLKI